MTWDAHAEARRTTDAHVFVDSAELGNDMITLDDDQARHLVRVLRLREGSEIGTSDGRGSWRATRLTGSGPDVVLEASSDVVTTQRAEPLLTVASALPKGDRLDWMVQKATELGVDRLQLLHCERSVVRWKSARVEAQLARMERVSRASARQSRRVWLPDILAPVESSAILPGAAIAEPGGARIDASHQLIAIGPEGGWSDAERALAREHVGLGPHVLRVETACLTAIALSVVARHGT